VNRLKEKSFTLLEIILVILVIGVIAGLTVPNFSKTYADIELKKGAEDLAYLMRYATGRAVIKNIKTRLEFNSEFSQYWLAEEIKDSVEAGEGEFKKISGRLGKKFNIPSGIKIELEDEFVSFYPDGSMDKKYIYVCNEKRCLIVSTKEKRGDVLVLEEE
jgi:hypothetical protein